MKTENQTASTPETTKHTPEPWKSAGERARQQLRNRSLACINACDTLTDSQLEQLGTGGVAKLMRDRDALMGLVKEVANDVEFGDNPEQYCEWHFRAVEAINQAEAAQ